MSTFCTFFAFAAAVDFLRVDGFLAALARFLPPVVVFVAIAILYACLPTVTTRLWYTYHMTSGKKHLQAFAAEYFHARRSPLGVSRAARQKAAAITTLIIDTKNLATGDLRFYRTIAKEGSDVTPHQAAIKALAGHATAESSVIMRALGADAPHILPIAAPNDIVLGSVWHRGEGFEAFWIGSLPSILHYADSTENEREHLHLLSRQLAAEGAVVYAVATSQGAAQPHRYRDVRATYIGLLIFHPVLFPGTEQAVAAIRAAGLSIIYASQNPEHVVQSFAHASCISPGPAIPYKHRRGHVLPHDKLLYAHLTAAARQQIIDSYGSKVLVVRGSLVAFWQQLKLLRK